MAPSPLRQLPYADAVSVLKKAGLAFCETVLAGSLGSSLAAASRLGYPVFLKLVSTPSGSAAIHKSKLGLVARAESSSQLEKAFARLEAAHRGLAGKKAVERKLVVAVQRPASGLELIIGARRDPSFGPVLVFGSGGVLAEVISDTSLRLCPVNADDAAAMVRETRAYKIIAGMKNSEKIVSGLAAILSGVSRLLESRPGIAELDINPVFADGATGELAAVDARMAVSGKSAESSKPLLQWRANAASAFFAPESIALIGASRSQDSVGQAIMRNLTIGCVHRCEYCRPFLGKIYPVNPFAAEILGIRCYQSLLAIPDKVDLAIIALPHGLVLKAVDQCIKKKVKAVIIISAGFGEFNDDGRKQQERIAEKLGAARIPLLGPNCLGIIRPSRSLNASFAPSMPPKGGVAFLSQSGALADSIIDWAIQARYGLSCLVSYGNKAMLDCHDFFGFLASDEETKSVALYIEGVGDGRRFFEGLKSLAGKKPVVVLKGGRTSTGVAAAATHTASIAGDARVFEAAVRQSGAVLAETVEELFDLAKVLGEQPSCRGNGIAIVTNGGGCGVIAADYCHELGISLPQLKKEVLAEFGKSGIMHPAYSRRNPLDIVGDALHDRYELAINTLLRQPDIHGLIVIQTLQAMTNPVLNAKVVVEAHKLFPGKPIISCFMGGRFSRKGMHYLDNMHIPDFNDIRKAVVAMKALIDRGQFLSDSAPAAPKAAASTQKKKR